jgi:hypothetical protein
LSQFKLSIESENALLFAESLVLATEGLKISPEITQIAKIIPTTTIYIDHAIKYLKLAGDVIAVYEDIRKEEGEIKPIDD